MTSIPWRMSQDTWRRWQRIVQRLDEIDETSEEAYILKDDARRLPGFPLHYDEHLDEIVPILIDSSGSRIRTPR